MRALAEPAHRFGPLAPSRSPARARLRAALIELALERGLADVDADSLCHEAAVARAVFEREYDGVRDCALQVYLAVGASAAEATFGAIYRFLAHELAGEGKTARAEEVVPELMYIAVRPYLGEEAAREELTIPAPPERRGRG